MLESLRSESAIPFEKPSPMNCLSQRKHAFLVSGNQNGYRRGLPIAAITENTSTVIFGRISHFKIKSR